MKFHILNLQAFEVDIVFKISSYTTFSQSTNIRLSVPLFALRIGTPSLFFHTQHLKGGVLQHDTKTTDTAERTNCRI